MSLPPLLVFWQIYLRMEGETTLGKASVGKTHSNDVGLGSSSYRASKPFVKYFSTEPRIKAFSFGDGATYKVLSCVNDFLHRTVATKSFYFYYHSSSCVWSLFLTSTSCDVNRLPSLHRLTLADQLPLGLPRSESAAMVLRRLSSSSTGQPWSMAATLSVPMVFGTPIFCPLNNLRFGGNNNNNNLSRAQVPLTT